MSEERERFIEERDYLLESKTDESAHDLAADLVLLMELLAVYGSSGMEGDDEKRRSYIRTLERRIRSVT